MKKLYVFFLILIPFFTYGQNEIKINTFAENDQRDPKIITDNNGIFIAVWSSLNQVANNSGEDIFMQQLDADLNKIGNEIQVNDSVPGSQIRPSAAMNNNGDFVIAWASFSGFTSIYDIKAKVYKKNNQASDEFLVNSFTANTQTRPSVDIREDGSFIIAWESWFEDGSDRGIYAQKFLSSGTKDGNAFLVNTTTKYSQARPAVKYFPDSKFIVVWESWDQEGTSSPGYGVFGRIFDAAGQPLSGEVQINDYTMDYQWFADVVTIDSDNFAVAWCSWEQDGSDGGIYLKRFNVNWESNNTEILVNSYRRYYQWLPKILKTPGDNIALVWSSWKQDGSREGIYSKIFDEKLREVSFEVRINDTQESFQWEPSAVAVDDYELVVLWSSYDETLKHYDVIGKRSTIQSVETISVQSSYEHPAGFSTTSFIVNVVDSSLLTGNNYEISFAENNENKIYASIKNMNTGSVIIPEIYLDMGEDAYYLTPVFEGIAVEIRPVFTLEIDFDKSRFINNSGSNIIFNFLNPSGTTVIAPIDLALIWGDASKNQDGTYTSPLDSAYSSEGKIEVKTPFKAWDITHNKKLYCFINEPSNTKNKRWDPGESIIILTPEEYQNNFPNFHVQINSNAPAGSLNYPAPGDSIFIFTRRPLSIDDVYTFSTSSNYITSVENPDALTPSFKLMQNYPNPFNPSTTISFSIPFDSAVKLKVFNILGELVKTIKDEYMQKGNYKVLLNSNSDSLKLASGVYFYTLEANNYFITKKMILLK